LKSIEKISTGMLTKLQVTPFAMKCKIIYKSSDKLF